MMGDLNMSNDFHEKLTNIQNKLKAPKSNYNSFSKFYFRSAEDILEAVKPLNFEHGLLLTITDEPVLIGDWHYIQAKAKITDGKDSLEVTAYAREAENKKGMDSSQITGTASSYARKYALNGLYLIDDTKDADTDEYKQTQNNVKKAPKSKIDLLNKLAFEVSKLYGLEIQVIKEKMNIYDDMSEDDVGAALLRLNEAKEKKENE